MEKKFQKVKSYISHFIDSTRFMASSSSNLVSTLSESNVNTDTMIKIVKSVKLNISIATFFLSTQTLKMI